MKTLQEWCYAKMLKAMNERSLAERNVYKWKRAFASVSTGHEISKKIVKQYNVWKETKEEYAD